MSSTAFFYGTLMSPDVRSRVLCGITTRLEAKKLKMSTLRCRPAVLKKYKRYALKNRDYPGIIYTGNDEDQVVGILCEGLSSPQDIRRLDAFEGDEYERRAVKAVVVPGPGEQEASEVDCQAYIWIEGEAELEDHDWEIEKFIQVKQAAWLDGNDEFSMVDRLEEV